MSKMVLDLNDFPKGWELAGRGERALSDVSASALDWGWRTGYYAVFQTRAPGDIPIVLATISNYISFYPKENISKVFDAPQTTATTERLSDPAIGERSQATKLTDSLGGVTYEIEFIKNGVYSALRGLGNIDYELLKDLARKASNKPLFLPDPLPPPPTRPSPASSAGVSPGATPREVIGTPTSATSPSPTPTATPLDCKLSMVSHKAQKNKYGWLELIGEVQNNNPVQAKSVQIYITYRDAVGSLVDSGSTYADPSDILPTDRAPFKTTLSDTAKVTQVKAYELRVGMRSENFDTIRCLEIYKGTVG
ncbi:MAG: hypothetical protein HY520_05290 [Candidatus Aenigmarchaeota archaeon]|nr:hypothetical protein [Candidatus Aenigmarchaeota archaeon]